VGFCIAVGRGFGNQHRLCRTRLSDTALGGNHFQPDFDSAGGVEESMLIDRAGQIRLIALGSYEGGTKALDEMLAKLLAEPIRTPP
jgi:hypothetical protein